MPLSFRLSDAEARYENSEGKSLVISFSRFNSGMDLAFVIVGVWHYVYLIRLSLWEGEA